MARFLGMEVSDSGRACPGVGSADARFVACPGRRVPTAHGDGPLQFRLSWRERVVHGWQFRTPGSHLARKPPLRPRYQAPETVNIRLWYKER